MTRNDDHAFSRRRLLRASAALSLAGVASTALGQESLPSELELGGRVSSWVGQAPDEIADERNPTLRLEAGQEYTLTWENLDGAAHNFVIVDENDERLVETDLVASSGETQTVEFTAEEGMVEYFCGPHRPSMTGEIELVGSGDGGDEAATDDGPPIGEGPTVGLESVADGFANPITLETADEDADRRFVVDQTGTISVHGEDGLASEPFLDVSDRLVDLREGFDERGLLGLAFHPDFAENGRFFVRYSAPPTEDAPEGYDHAFVLSEFRTADDDHASADPDSERRLLEIPEPQFNHNAGPIAFGPDGYLYVATGDGGGANDSGEGHVEDWYDENEGGNGQDTEENLLGGILRIDVDGGTSETSRDGGGDAADEGDERAYGVPDDNPLVDAEGHRDEYYAWGLRNPWGMTLTGEGAILAADVGQELFEEVNHVERGGNYGWNVREGTHCFSTESPTEPPAECPAETPESVRGGEPLLDPVLEYPHEADGEPVGVSVIGGFLYEGEAVDALAGTYVFGDWSRDGQSPGRLFAARPPTEWLEENAAVETDTGEDDGGDEADSGEAESEGGRWPIEELEVETASGGDDGGDEADDGDGEEDDGEPVASDGAMNRFVYGFGRDDAGELYVLTSATPSIEEDDGAVYRIVPQQRSEH
ncbi:plastocyanin [Natrinema saccharevitans]|uniref:Plastocyanin n=1 Tax=Natrinema saccharevitans TaxID=301967 RepID=A0A1S8B0T2_9EURY|nr:PQQ-dependent sugar dehydrogenase [Natrinema saccharevitans]OLZ42645.1 plastocyanin [Natrinema saccharevitans]